MNLIDAYNAGFRSARAGAIIGNPFSGDAYRRAAWQQGYDDGQTRARTPIMGQPGEGEVTGGGQDNLWPDRLDPKREPPRRRRRATIESAITELFGFKV